MQTVRKKILAIAGLLILFSTVACQKWVDDTPQPLQVDESKLFSTEKGFREALNGVYLEMGASNLYGKDLTFGALSLLGRSYDSVSVKKVSAFHYQAAIYNLQDPLVKTYSADVWNRMYQAIANLNNVLVNVETKKSIFTGTNYSTFKGEALALRAYLHFDLLRLFAPAPSTGALASPAIPYVTTINFNTTPVSSVAQVLDQCVTDLTEADKLLDANDLTTSQVTKWGVRGLLARLYMYKGDNALANEYALDVIKNSRISLGSTGNDLMYTNESLFKLYIYNVNYNNYNKSVFADPSLIGMSVNAQTALYTTGNNSTTTDYRKNFVTASGNTTGTLSSPVIMPKKFYAQSSTPNIFPMIRLTEMYYIAAECATDVATGLSYINPVRVARNLSQLTTANVPDMTSLSTELLNEYKKEFVGEGQMFFYYKRKNTPFNKLPFYPVNPELPRAGEVKVVSNATYTFVKPE